MQPKDWKKVKNILQDVLKLSPEKRNVYLKDLDINEDLRQEVDSLLMFENEAEDMMEVSAVSFSDDFYDEYGNIQENLKGKKIGSYQILKELGTGGMGAVYLAERTDGEFDRKVAVKMLRREFNTSEIRKRFKQEKEIQANLIHPNIARLIDAGTTEDDIPYIVMEYIEGKTIDNFCQMNHLQFEDRLKLFNKVCDAVAFAHRNLIIHRDLKPSNIIVTKNGEPKLLDFGISKMLSGEVKEAQTVTKMGVMTPEYASPEQIKGKSVTTSTDIYSLGVILFELLVGQRPFGEEIKEKGNIFQSILESEPDRPSDVLLKIQTSDKPQIEEKDLKEFENIETDEAKTAIMGEEVTKKLINKTKPQFTSTSPKRLVGDIDNIILKSLRKEPERRYQTVEQLSADIWRHLDGMPVLARPATFSYRASKFINRNKAGVLAGFLVLLAVITGVIATLWQARVARAERAKAEKRFNDVRSLANSFLFEITPEIEKLPGSTRARELVVKRALEYLDNLSKEAGDDAELQKELATAYIKVGNVQGNPYDDNLGDIKDAEKSYEKARVILDDLYKNNPNDLSIQENFAKVYELIGDVNFYGDDTEKAENSYKKSLEFLEKIAATKPNDIETQKKIGKVINEIALITFWNGKNKKSLEISERSRSIFEKLYKENPEDKEVIKQTANTYLRIGEVLGWEERYDEAKDLLDKALKMLKELSAKYPKDLDLRRTYMIAYFRKGENYADTKNYDESIKSYRTAEEMAQTALDEDPKNAKAQRDLIMMKFKVAETLDIAGKNQEGLKILEEVLTFQKGLEKSDPSNAEHPYDVAKTINAIGEAHKNLKNFDKALETFEASENKYKELLKKEKDNQKYRRGVAIVKENIGETYSLMAKDSKQKTLREKAVENLKESLEIYAKLKDENVLSELDIKEMEEIKKMLEAEQKLVKEN